MSLSKEKIAHQVIVHLEKIGIKLNDNDKKRLAEQNMVTIFKSECKVANTMTASRFNVTVNKKWLSQADNKEKPYFRVANSGPRIEFENVLFPTKHSLFMLHYLSLRECCLELELDRNKWFDQSTWGVELDEDSETFKWAGGNKKQFKVRKISSLNELEIESLQTPLACDIAEPSLPERALIATYRVLRDTKISREIKQLYECQCQICGTKLSLGNNLFYAEVHHIKPLGTPHNGPDVVQNVLCLCPNHHVMLDYGALKLGKETFKISSHSVSEDYINYHNDVIFKKDMR